MKGMTGRDSLRTKETLCAGFALQQSLNKETAGPQFNLPLCTVTLQAMSHNALTSVRVRRSSTSLSSMHAPAAPLQPKLRPALHSMCAGSPPLTSPRLEAEGGVQD